MISPSRMKELAEEEMTDRECTELGRITIGDEKFILNYVINPAGVHMCTIVEDKEDGEGQIHADLHFPLHARQQYGQHQQHQV